MTSEMTPEQAAQLIFDKAMMAASYHDVDATAAIIQAQREQAVKEANTQLKAQVAGLVEVLRKECKPCGCCLAEFNCEVERIIADFTIFTEQYDEAVRAQERERIAEEVKELVSYTHDMHYFIRNLENPSYQEIAEKAKKLACRLVPPPSFKEVQEIFRKAREEAIEGGEGVPT